MSANLPTVVANTPPILAVNEQEPNPTFLQNKIESFPEKNVPLPTELPGTAARLFYH